VDALLERRLHQRIQARGRLVQQEQLGVRRERGDERDLLPVALGVGAGLLARVEVEALQQLGAALGVQATAQPAEQVDGLASGQVRPDQILARYDSSLREGIAALGPDSPAARRLTETLEFFEFIGEELHGIIARWQRHKQSLRSRVPATPTA
jgi:hypothetical protein